MIWPFQNLEGSKFMRIFLILFLVLVATTQSFGWDFSLNGVYEWRFNYVSRIGESDLFGSAQNAQADGSPGLTTIGLSGPNSNVVTPEGFSSKGSDASYNEERFWLFPKIHVNRAVTLNGLFSFQSDLNGPFQGGPNWVNPPHRAGWYYSASRSDSGYDAVSTIMLRHLWANVETPLFTLKFGRRPFLFGTGWAGYSLRETVDTSVGLDIPYGPFLFKSGFFLADNGEFTSPYDTRNANRTIYTIASSVDRNEARKLDFYAGLVYRYGNFDFGYLNRTIYYNRVHSVPFTTTTLRDDMVGSFPQYFLSAYRNDADGNLTTIPIYGNSLLMNNLVYFKYFNGRYAANVEYAIQTINTTRDGGRPISGAPWSLMGEFSGLAGPMKMSLAYFYHSGHDRAGGVLDTSSATGTGITQTGDSWAQYIMSGGCYTAIEPYNWLIGLYGSGNNSYDASGYPIYLDFQSVAGRLDYAVAANINTWLSYMYARRASNTGSWWGQYTGGVTVAPTRGSNVPNNNLGQEFNVGIDWKLLEGVNWKTRFAYWKPGEWFKWAYQDYSSPTFLTDPLSDTQVRINPDRSISPIMGFRTGVSVAF